MILVCDQDSSLCMLTASLCLAFLIYATLVNIHMQTAFDQLVNGAKMGVSKAVRNNEYGVFTVNVSQITSVMKSTTNCKKCRFA